MFGRPFGQGRNGIYGIVNRDRRISRADLMLFRNSFAGPLRPLAIPSVGIESFSCHLFQFIGDCDKKTASRTQPSVRGTV